MCSDGLMEDLATDLDSAFERLVRSYQDRLFAFTLRLTSSPRDAEEIVQDSFVAAYHALARYPPEQIRTLALRAWLYRIALNRTRNHLRRRSPLLLPLESEGTSVKAAEGERPDRAAERNESATELAQRLTDLPERYRIAVILRHVVGLGYAEIATITQQPVGTVKAHVHRGLRLLREQLTAASLA